MAHFMRRVGLAVAVLALQAGAAGKARAGVVLDYSPATTGATLAGPWYNTVDVQNFAERVTFGSDTSLTGMDIYTEEFYGLYGAIGQSVTIRLWDGTAAAPGSLLTQFTSTVSARDTAGAVAGTTAVRVHADFAAALTLLGGSTYWIGMSGTSSQLGLLGLIGAHAPDDGRMAQWQWGIESMTDSYVGDMAFRLYGDRVSAVPEPSALISGGIGCLMAIGYAWRHRKRSPT